MDATRYEGRERSSIRRMIVKNLRGVCIEKEVPDKDSARQRIEGLASG